MGWLPVLGCMFKYWFYGGNDGYFGNFSQLGKRFAGSSRNARRFIRIVAENEPGIITNITAYLTENGVKVRTLNVKNNSRKMR